MIRITIILNKVRKKTMRLHLDLATILNKNPDIAINLE